MHPDTAVNHTPEADTPFWWSNKIYPPNFIKFRTEILDFVLIFKAYIKKSDLDDKRLYPFRIDI